LINSFVHSSTHSSFIRSFIGFLIHLLIGSFISSLIHSLVHSFIGSFIGSFINWLLDLTCVYFSLQRHSLKFHSAQTVRVKWSSRCHWSLRERRWSSLNLANCHEPIPV